MGIFSNLKKNKPDPWFCISCDLASGTMRLPLEMDHDPWPDVKFSDRMAIGEDSARLYTRAATAKDAKIQARAHMDAYKATRSSKGKSRVAA